MAWRDRLSCKPRFGGELDGEVEEVQVNECIKLGGAAVVRYWWLEAVLMHVYGVAVTSKLHLWLQG
jgi:hypothetical protein